MTYQNDDVSTNGHVNKNGHCVTKEERTTFQYTSIREPLKLLIQIAYVVAIFIPVVIWSTWKLFFASEKSLKGQIALVSNNFLSNVWFH